MDNHLYTYGGIRSICHMYSSWYDPNEQDLTHRGNNPNREALSNKH